MSDVTADSGKLQLMAEIERLYRETATVKEKWLGAMAEIERLQAENAAWKHENNLAYAEVDRLKPQLEQTHRARSISAGGEAMSQHVAHRHSDEINQLKAEIERLKAALREIADSDVHWRAVNIARVALAALEGDEALFPTKKICPECGQPMREGGYCDHIPF